MTADPTVISVTSILQAIGAVSATVVILVGFIAYIIRTHQTGKVQQKEIDSLWETIKDCKSKCGETVLGQNDCLSGVKQRLSRLEEARHEQDARLDRGERRFERMEKTMNQIGKDVSGATATLRSLAEVITDFQKEFRRNIERQLGGSDHVHENDK